MRGLGPLCLIGVHRGCRAANCVCAHHVYDEMRDEEIAERAVIDQDEAAFGINLAHLYDADGNVAEHVTVPSRNTLLRQLSFSTQRKIQQAREKQ